MKNAVILCAGAGTKIWPYNKMRCKAMLPVSNLPIAAHLVNSLNELGFEKIIIVGGKFVEEMLNYFCDYKNVEIIVDENPRGTASSLFKARGMFDGDFLALYGDTIVDKADLSALIDAYSGAPCALVDRIRFDRPADHIGCTIADGAIDEIIGHDDGSTHLFAGFAFGSDIFESLEVNPGRFTAVGVGMMSPKESYIEMTLADILSRGGKVQAVESKLPVHDIDKPWQILQASFDINRRRCSALTQNILAPGASIDESASISGYVSLGKNSIIGKNVIIEGNVIVGDNSKIINGAIVQGNVVIGSNTSVRNACFISEGSTVGDDCIVSHAAELEGVIFRRVYLYHYMEIFGIIGENTDIGAATVCGSMRFDSGVSMQRAKGRREFPTEWGNATFIGDYCRTGVNAVFMPGVKVGAYSVVGAGVVLNRDLADNTLVYAEQTLKEKPWGTEVYGW